MAPLPTKQHLDEHLDEAINALKSAVAHLKVFTYSLAGTMEQEMGAMIDTLEQRKEQTSILYEFERQRIRRPT